jgi:hypothetical protein
MSRLQLALDQIGFARTYTLRLLASTKEADWFRQPAGGITHIGWQVGHVARAQYLLAIALIRGPRPQDALLISDEFLRLFARESVPDPDPAKYPQPTEIRAVLDRVHKQVLHEIPHLEDVQLDVAPLREHSLAKTKLWSLLWCAQHEMLHAGQIGLLRRQLGYPPLW